MDIEQGQDSWFLPNLVCCDWLPQPSSYPNLTDGLSGFVTLPLYLIIPRLLPYPHGSDGLIPRTQTWAFCHVITCTGQVPRLPCPTYPPVPLLPPHPTCVPAL